MKKVKLLAFTCSSGDKWCTVCPSPRDNERFAEIIEDDFAPWLPGIYPDKQELRILLDGERLFRAPKPKKAFADAHIKVLEDWPPRSPDFNPQENVWAWTEARLRKAEPDDEPYDDFVVRLQEVMDTVPSQMCKNPVMSMHTRMAKVLENKGGRIKY